jgi:hypothetical protein
MPKNKDDFTRKRGKDKMKERFDFQGKFSSKHLRIQEAIAEKRKLEKRVEPVEPVEPAPAKKC